MASPLAGLRVLELGTFVSAPYCGKLFAGYGAEVIKIEPPGGDLARAHGPFKDGVPNPETSALFLYLNTGKKSIELDLSTAAGLDAFMRLAETADVIIENFRPSDLRAMGVSYEAVKRINPKVTFVSITAFGQEGPYSDYQANNLIGFAMGGQMFITGTQDAGPLKNGGYQADYQGGLNGFSAAMLAVLAAERDGEGQHVDISVQQCMAPILESGIPLYSYMGRFNAVRRGNHMASFIGVYPCQDGHVGVHIMARNWAPFVKTIGREEWLDDPRFATQAARVVNNDDLMAELYGWAATVTKKEAYAAGGVGRAPIAYVHTMEDVMTSPQLNSRGYLTKITHPVAGEATYPGPPWWVGEDGWSHAPAPLLGEHTDAILREAGFSDAELQLLRVERPE